MTSSSNLRRPSHLKRSLDQNQEPLATLFDAPDYQLEEAAGKDHDLFDQFNNQDQDGPHQDVLYQDGPYQDNHQYNPKQPQSTLPFKPQQPQPQLQQHSQDSADWDTRAKIFLSEVIVVTVIVGTVLFFCLRKHRRRLIQQTFTAQQMQEWTTIRIPPHTDAQGAQQGGQTVMVARTRDGRTRVRVDSNMSGMVSIHSRHSAGGTGISRGVGDAASRMRVDSGISGMVSVPSAAHQDHPVGSASAGSDHPEHSETTNNANRTALSRLLSVPRRIGNVVLYPLRLLEAGVNDWATENYDETFLRQFMERLEAEREAARENPDDREMRLKEAFMKECMVWELGDEHFLPPKKLGDDGDNLKATTPLYSTLGGEGTIKCIKEIDIDDDDKEGMNYGLYPVKNLQDMEEGNFQGTFVQDLSHQQDEEEVKHEQAQDAVNEESKIEGVQPFSEGESCEGKENIEQDADTSSSENKLPQVNEDGSEPKTNQNDCAVTEHDAPATDDENALATSNETSAMEQQTPPSIDVTAPSAATIHAQPTSPSSVLVGGTAAGTLHTSVLPTTIPAAEDTFDEDAAPGYLYLNSSGQNRRRANTGGSINTSLSSSGHTTLSSAESMESMASSAEASQDSHKIPNECAICLCGYEKGDTIVTSCNSECPHAFHQECIVEWLVKMQDGTPCPCCRRTFVELDEHTPGSLGGSSTNNTINRNNNSNANRNATNSDGNATNNNANAAEENAEAERLRQDRRRRSIEQGIQRGRAFNMSVISLRNSRTANDINTRDPEEAERLRQVRQRNNFELGLRRGGRAFNTSVIALR